MSRLLEGYRAAILASLVAAGMASAGPGLSAAQSPDPTQPATNAPASVEPATSPASSPATASVPAEPATPAEPAVPAATPAGPANPADTAPARKIYTVPAGTKVLLELRSAINTKSAKAGDGVYLSSTFPVVVGNRVMIPNGVYVQGVVDRVQRGGMRDQSATGHALYLDHLPQRQRG